MAIMIDVRIDRRVGGFCCCMAAFRRRAAQRSTPDAREAVAEQCARSCRVLPAIAIDVGPPVWCSALPI
jgi:hypothetical protein